MAGKPCSCNSYDPEPSKFHHLPTRSEALDVVTNDATICSNMFHACDSLPNSESGVPAKRCCHSS
eukprot:6281378-Amphidinium_carterae.1